MQINFTRFKFILDRIFDTAEDIRLQKQVNNVSAAREFHVTKSVH